MKSEIIESEFYNGGNFVLNMFPSNIAEYKSIDIEDLVIISYISYDAWVQRGVSELHRPCLQLPQILLCHHVPSCYSWQKKSLKNLVCRIIPECLISYSHAYSSKTGTKRKFLGTRRNGTSVSLLYIDISV